MSRSRLRAPVRRHVQQMSQPLVSGAGQTQSPRYGMSAKCLDQSPLDHQQAVPGDSDAGIPSVVYVWQNLPTSLIPSPPVNSFCSPFAPCSPLALQAEPAATDQARHLVEDLTQHDCPSAHGVSGLRSPLAPQAEPTSAGHQTYYVISARVEILPAAHAENELQDKPVWDAQTRRLYFRDMLIKEFRQPAKNQIAILDAFQDAGWPESIVDPLPADDADAHERLHNVVQRLNDQPQPLILFKRDGTGTGIRWFAR